MRKYVYTLHVLIFQFAGQTDFLPYGKNDGHGDQDNHHGYAQYQRKGVAFFISHG